MKTLLLFMKVVLGGFGKQKKAKNDLNGHFLHLTLNSFGLDIVCPPVLCMEAGALDLAQPKLDCCSRFYSIRRASVPLKHRNARRLCTSQSFTTICADSRIVARCCSRVGTPAFEG